MWLSICDHGSTIDATRFQNTSDVVRLFVDSSITLSKVFRRKRLRTTIIWQKNAKNSFFLLHVYNCIFGERKIDVDEETWMKWAAHLRKSFKKLREEKKKNVVSIDKWKMASFCNICL